MTPEQRQAARERCNKATPGPWTLDTFYYCYIWGPHMQMVADDGLDEAGTLTRMRGVGANLPLKDNGDFIAHARTDLPAALDALDEADKRIAELSEENSQMARMLAEPSENQELKARIAELTADAEFLTTPERLAEIIGKKNARIAELKLALMRVRQGYQNILDFRKCNDGRYGALTREEIEGVIGEIDTAFASRTAHAVKPETKPC